MSSDKAGIAGNENRSLVVTQATEIAHCSLDGASEEMWKWCGKKINFSEISLKIQLRLKPETCAACSLLDSPGVFGSIPTSIRHDTRMQLLISVEGLPEVEAL